MADDDLDEDIDEEGEYDEDEEGEGGGGGGKKKLLLLIVLPLLLVIGGAAGAYFMGYLDPVLAMIVGEEQTAEGEEGDSKEGEDGVPLTVVFYDLPELLVNLNTGGRKTSYLKIRISLELEKAEDQAKMEALMPRVIDNFQVYLRELRVNDLKGSAGMYRLREEMLTRVNAAVAPARVNDVLFKEMLVQ
ncbi:MAG: flagellar basal body-associated FliL family protein [Alphaproteobacteria bacterium]|nr:flagellar basal body-associated FliL family protein [Rhodospirillales bacterium]MCW9046363.1 flagellar basal body-associated FliL family protein [Alphaproteobacteria bacterium]